MIIAVATMLFTACDTIPENEYCIFAGAVLNWEQGESFEAEQNAYVEKYTGPKCPNCPSADVTLDGAHQQYGERLVLISVNHFEGQGENFNGYPDMRTEDGTTWDKYYGINAIPAAYINRRTATQYSGTMSNITADIGTALAETPKIGLRVSASDEDRDGRVDIEVDLCFAENVARPLALTLALTEDSLVYKQSMPDGTRQEDYVHNHMLRDVITDVWGADVNATGAAGESLKATVRFTVAEDFKIENCNIVALVSDKETREVLNSAQTRIAR